jgi:hypothetical protein
MLPPLRPTGFRCFLCSVVPTAHWCYVELALFPCFHLGRITRTWCKH